MAPVFHFIQSVLGDQRLIISKLKFVKNIFELYFLMLAVGSSRFWDFSGMKMFGNVFVCFHLVQRQEEGGEIQEKIQDSPQKLQQRQEVSEH